MIDRVIIPPSDYDESMLLYVFEHAGQQRAVWLHKINAKGEHNVGYYVVRPEGDLRIPMSSAAFEQRYEVAGAAEGKGAAVTEIEDAARDDVPAPDLPPVVGIPDGDNRVKVDIDAVRRSCKSAIANRPGDASIPRVVISADILLAIIFHVDQVRRISDSMSACASALADVVGQGPIVGGAGAADAAGEVVVDHRLVGYRMVRS